MDTIRDFEDMLELLHEHEVRYLIIGGLAVTYHARPRYTKDMDLWIDPDPENVRNANAALAEFGSPFLLDLGAREQVVQVGLPPNRIDLLVDPGPVAFEEAWNDRISARYGEAPAEWIGLDSLIAIKKSIDHPRHREDTRVLEEVRRRRTKD